MIDVTLDKYGDNMWTLAAENGTEEVMNFLLDVIKDWPRKDLHHVLHFWTCHRERSCMDIVEKHKPIILAFSYTDSKFENLKTHLKINSSDPSKLYNYLITLKQYLDTNIVHLGKSFLPWQTYFTRKHLSMIDGLVWTINRPKQTFQL